MTDADPVTDGGREIDPEAYYVLDNLQDTVVAGPLDRDAALDTARDRGPGDNIVVSGASLGQLDTARTLAWEIDDGPTVVTDGGRIHEASADDDTPLIAAGVNTDERVELTIIGDPSHSINLNIDDARQLHYALGHALEAVSDGGGAQ